MPKLRRLIGSWFGLLVLVLALTLGSPGQALSIPRPAAAPTQGSLWQRYDLSGSDLRAVDVLDANTAWAVGTDGLLVRWDGANWTAYDNTKLGSHAFNGVDMVAADAAWAVASSDIVARWNGTAWLAEPSNTGPATLYDVGMASPSDGWIVGTNGTFARYNGTTWQPVATSAVTMTMYSVAVVDSNNAWAVGGGWVRATSAR